MENRNDWSELMARGSLCLGAADLEAAAGGGATAEVQKHLQECATCQADVEMLRSFATGAPGSNESAAVASIERALKEQPRWKSPAAEAKPPFWAWLFHGRPLTGALIAGLASLVAVGVFLRSPGTPADPGVSISDVTRSSQVSGLAPVGDLTAPPTAITWSAVPEAVKYQIYLEEVDGTKIGQFESDSAQFTVPEAAQKLMADRKTLYWRVGALASDGRAVANPAFERFRVLRGK